MPVGERSLEDECVGETNGCAKIDAMCGPRVTIRKFTVETIAKNELGETMIRKCANKRVAIS